MNNPEKKNYPRVPRRLDLLYIDQPLYFLTCCTDQRKPILANRGVHKIFEKYANDSMPRVAVGRYVIMPDHVHLFLRGNPGFSVSSWVGRLKQKITMHLKDHGVVCPVWQIGFFDHVLRSDESYAEKWRYVQLNPVRAGLVDNQGDWPYQGELVRIDRA